MRDAKEALRHQVDYLEDALAEKEAEIARLREEAADAKPTAKKRKKKQRIAVKTEPESEPPPAPELKFGALRPDGSVRYVVRPIETIWVGIMAAVSLFFVTFVAMSITHGQTFPWPMVPIFSVLPLMPTFRGGFDVHTTEKTIRVWQSWGPINYSSFSLQRLKLPDVRTTMETQNDSDARARVTRLYWGSQHIRTTLPASQLSELMDEARALVASAGKS